jgi:hypothetical protein
MAVVVEVEALPTAALLLLIKLHQTFTIISCGKHSPKLKVSTTAVRHHF